MPEKFVVIVVDGLIGAGKTVLIKDCLVPIFSKLGWRITVVDEPVEKWQKNGRLQQFYDDPRRRGYQFQTQAFHDRVRESQYKFEKYKDCTDIFLLERSIFSDRFFAEMLFESGTMDKTEYEDYIELWTMWKEVMPFQPDLFIYLKPDIAVVMQRIKKRSRNEENSVTNEYQTLLQKKHDKFLGGDLVSITGSDVPCYHLYTNSNFRDDITVQKKIVNDIEEFITQI